MKMHPVKSSKIDVIGYDDATHKMRVSFRGDSSLDFCHVPEAVFNAFLHARSKNRFFKRHILGVFPS
ncbi:MULTISPECIES: KTSC domain-containing protein [Methylomonas]|uniref:KTSC domain-containing protein n=1 Tax=Methylomonas TaxID=416 RepID=UPI001232D1EC|nr:KTSC domain-containing protein [Methylomonas rhizoryzae]